MSRYLVTVVDTFMVEAADADDAIAQVAELRPSTRADTSDVWAELADMGGGGLTGEASFKGEGRGHSPSEVEAVTSRAPQPPADGDLTVATDAQVGQ